MSENFWAALPSPSGSLTETDFYYLDVLTRNDSQEIGNVIARSHERVPFWFFQRIATSDVPSHHLLFFKCRFSPSFLARPEVQDLYVTIARWGNPIVLRALAYSSHLSEGTKMKLVDVITTLPNSRADMDNALDAIVNSAKSPALVEKVYNLTSKYSTSLLCSVASNPAASKEILKNLLTHYNSQVRDRAANNSSLNVHDFVDIVIANPASHAFNLHPIFEHADSHQLLTKMLTNWGVIDGSIELPLAVLELYVEGYCEEKERNYGKNEPSTGS